MSGDEPAVDDFFGSRAVVELVPLPGEGELGVSGAVWGTSRLVLIADLVGVSKGAGDSLAVTKDEASGGLLAESRAVGLDLKGFFGVIGAVTKESLLFFGLLPSGSCDLFGRLFDPSEGFGCCCRAASS